MAYRDIYSTQLLNDIHNYFPEILYNRYRFQTVPDLLSYIHEVTEISSYTRGLRQYRIQQSYNRLNRYNENRANIRRTSGTATHDSVLGEFAFMSSVALGLTHEDQRVIIHPTPNEIQIASRIFTVSERQEDNCAICQDEIIGEQQLRRLTHCSHYFHKVCIDSWFLQNVRCPTCRHDIRNI